MACLQTLCNLVSGWDVVGGAMMTTERWELPEPLWARLKKLI